MGEFSVAHRLVSPSGEHPKDRCETAPCLGRSWWTLVLPSANTYNFIPGLKGHILQSLDVQAGISMGRCWQVYFDQIHAQMKLL